MKTRSEPFRFAPVLVAVSLAFAPGFAKAQAPKAGARNLGAALGTSPVVPVQDVQKDRSSGNSGAEASKGPTLNIPGLPPIQMPPGTRVFGPNGPRSLPGSPPVPPRRAQGNEPDAGKNAGKAADPKSADADKDKKKRKVQTRADALNELFERLAKAESEREARGITRAIERLWAQSGSPTADILMGRALRSFRKKNYKLALQLLDKIVVVKPQWAEGWNQRATARYYNEDPMGSIADIARALAREPRHYNALVGLGLILRRAEENKRALQVFRKALELNPQNKKIKDLVDRLKIMVEGREI